MSASDPPNPSDWVDVDDAFPLWLPTLGAPHDDVGEGAWGGLIACHNALCEGQLDEARAAAGEACELASGSEWLPLTLICSAKVEFLAGHRDRVTEILAPIEPDTEAFQLASILAAYADHCAGQLESASARLRAVEPTNPLIECLLLRARIELRLEQGRLEAVRRDTSQMRRVALPESLVDHAAFADLVDGACGWLDGRSPMDAATPYARFLRATDCYGGELVRALAAATTWKVHAETEPSGLPMLEAFSADAAEVGELWTRFHDASTDEQFEEIAASLRGLNERALDGTPANPWVRLLERELGRRVTARLLPVGTSDDPVVRVAVHSSCDWIRVGEQTADLAARRALRQIMKALLKTHFIDPARKFSVDDVLEAGWPGESVVASAARSRVYTAIRQLRGMGLGELIVTEDDGYRISRNAQISVEATTELAALLPDAR